MSRGAHPTPEQLQRAYEGLAKRHQWAEPFEAVMTHPLRSRLVRAMAVGMALRRARLHAQHAQQGGQAARGADFKARPVPTPQFDLKRAAAGDLD